MKPILHHYPPSLFSEKVRALLGYLDLAWQSVIIPPIMPRPDLMPLSGGYRKTPIMQIGADIYCDTEIICRTLARQADNTRLYQAGFVAERFARWADTELFRITVALNFRPQALAVQMQQMSEADQQAFAKDRAELSGSDQIVSLDPATAEVHFRALLKQLENSLSKDFLFGDDPSIADFSLYHCLWFVAGNKANTHLFTDHPRVRAYMARLQAFGHGEYNDLSSSAALSIGADTTPLAAAEFTVDASLAGDLNAGDAVDVTPDDYGRFAVSGTLLGWQADEIVIRRTDPKAGEVNVHFPNFGFGVTTAAEPN